MEEEYADIYYVDARNASRDHRTGRPAAIGTRPRPVSTQTVYMPPPARPSAYGQPAPYAQPAPVYQPGPVIYSAPPVGSTAAMLLGKLTTGQVVDMVAQIFAALQSLPGAPVATRDVSTDVSNLILYQGALAQHAKRDEQVRTLGGLVARLVG